MNCPNGTIKLTTKMVDMPDGKKKRKLDKYYYDLGSCTFCMLCVTTCPQHALEFSNDFEQAVFERDKLVKHLNYLPEKEDAPVAKPAVDPAVIAEAKAKAAKILAEKRAAEANAQENKEPEAK
jgi:NADH-quinone oxidoreductase subunit I